ncbi:MAG: FAD-binding domain-containing protein [Thiomicrospira sp.]|jgi:deoxyribodipyrimidine photo-lyase|nr:FAD-binding domain-containing protein [Thiomicrospira sp.]
MLRLTTEFANRAALIDYVRQLSGAAMEPVSDIQGGLTQACQKSAALNPIAYQRERNFFTGSVSVLSPYIRHGVISPKALADQLAERYPPSQRAGFVQQLAWRDYFHRVHQAQPERIWQDYEPYKTGFSAADYAPSLPDDIANGETGVRVIDQMIDTLLMRGYLHNHARLYLAAYVVHWRRVRWQAGARWFLQHLIDGDIVCNNYSWQWVASTFSAKPYFFNLDNLRHYADGQLDCEHQSHRIFDASYDELSARLFPHLTDARGR